MGSTFQIAMNMRTAGGYVRFAEFDLGMNREAVEEAVVLTW